MLSSFVAASAIRAGIDNTSASSEADWAKESSLAARAKSHATLPAAVPASFATFAATSPASRSFSWVSGFFKNPPRPSLLQPTPPPSLSPLTNCAAISFFLAATSCLEWHHHCPRNAADDNVAQRRVINGGLRARQAWAMRCHNILLLSQRTKLRCHRLQS